MPQYCTCTAELPPDARFCHKCGRPLVEMPEPEPEEHEQPVVVATPAPPPPPVVDVGFRNPLAVRIGLVVALLCFFASALSGSVMVLPLFWLLAAGFLSVYLYRRRTGLALTLSSGARMGWMTGLFAFMILLVMLTTIVLALSDQSFAARALEEMRARGADDSAQQMMEAFRTPSGIIQILLLSFVVFTVFPTLGGALGAKLLGPPWRKSPRT